MSCLICGKCLTEFSIYRKTLFFFLDEVLAVNKCNSNYITEPAGNLVKSLQRSN